MQLRCFETTVVIDTVSARWLPTVNTCVASGRLCDVACGLLGRTVARKNVVISLGRLCTSLVLVTTQQYDTVYCLSTCEGQQDLKQISSFDVKFLLHPQRSYIRFRTVQKSFRLFPPHRLINTSMRISRECPSLAVQD